MDYKIRKYKELASTNTEAAGIENFEHLETVTAECQTLGRGRMGRSFYSKGGGLYMSVLLKPDMIKCSASLVTFAAAVSLRDALFSFGYETGIKWVNDILYGGKKIAGILTEAKSSDGALKRIIVGIGVNLKEPEDGFPDDIKHKAGALDFNGDKDSLIIRIISNLSENLLKRDEEIISEYKKNMLMIGDTAEVSDYRSGCKKRVRILGLRGDGALICEEADGKMIDLVSGEVLY